MHEHPRAYPPIRDHAIIGNLRSAVLVTTDACIDWACAPFIDSPSVFASLLDAQNGGYWQITPADAYESSQYYEEDTNVLVTRFTTKTGVLTVTDFLPIERVSEHVPAEEDTTFRIHRKAACVEGEVAVEVDFSPRFDYARNETVLEGTPEGIVAQNGAMHGMLSGTCAFETVSGHARAAFTLHAGDAHYLVFRYNIRHPVSQERQSVEHHERELEETKTFWREWVARCDIAQCPEHGPWRREVVRSLLTLKSLFFEPLGTVAAAATTSLPEEIGGVRNWDYRFTWLRDAAFIFQAFFTTGHIHEAKEYMHWLRAHCRGETGDGPENLTILYGLRDDSELHECELEHLEGYMGSAPVRIGNAAYEQRQWDIYGSIFDVIWKLHMLGDVEHVTGSEWPFFAAMADHVTTIWREPDEGLWEVRGDTQHYVYSKVMCWVALDRALKISAAHELSGNTRIWERERDAIREAVLDRGFDAKRGSFVQTLDGTALDAALLLLPSVGFIDGADPKMVGTIRAIEEHLGCGEGLLRRYTTDDGLPGTEGAFLLSSFWLVDALVAAGELERAQALFETLCGHANHVGLYAEEMDPATGIFLGNFPQAYTHIGLITSARLLTDARRARGESV